MGRGISRRGEGATFVTYLLTGALCDCYLVVDSSDKMDDSKIVDVRVRAVGW